MRLSEWRAKTPFKNAVSPKVVAVIESALATLGGDRDPDCWIVWGDDPGVRYLLLAPTPSGLVQLHVRVNVAGEGPRAGGKVVRWNRVQLGELAVEIQGGHRLVTFQAETQVLNGSDDLADRISEFAQVLFAAVDGRPAPVPGARKTRKASQPKSSAVSAGPTKGAARRSPAAAGGATKASPPTSNAAKTSPAKASPAKKASMPARVAPRPASPLAASKGTRT